MAQEKKMERNANTVTMENQLRRDAAASAVSVIDLTLDLDTFISRTRGLQPVPLPYVAVEAVCEQRIQGAEFTVFIPSVTEMNASRGPPRGERFHWQSINREEKNLTTAMVIPRETNYDIAIVVVRAPASGARGCPTRAHYVIVGTGVFRLEPRKWFNNAKQRIPAVPIYYRATDQAPMMTLQLFLHIPSHVPLHMNKSMDNLVHAGNWDAAQAQLQNDIRLAMQLSQEGTEFYNRTPANANPFGLAKWHTDKKSFPLCMAPPFYCLVPLMKFHVGPDWARAIHVLTQQACSMAGLDIALKDDALEVLSGGLNMILNNLLVTLVLRIAYRADKRPRLVHTSSSEEEKDMVRDSENADQWINPMLLSSVAAYAVIDCEDSAQLVFMIFRVLQQMPEDFCCDRIAADKNHPFQDAFWTDNADPATKTVVNRVLAAMSSGKPRQLAREADMAAAAAAVAQAEVSEETKQKQQPSPQHQGGGDKADEVPFTPNVTLMSLMRGLHYRAKEYVVMMVTCVLAAEGRYRRSARFASTMGSASFHVLTVALDRRVFQYLTNPVRKDRRLRWEEQVREAGGKLAPRPTLVLEGTAWTMGCFDFGVFHQSDGCTEALGIKNVQTCIDADRVRQSKQYRNVVAAYVSWQDSDELGVPQCMGEYAFCCRKSKKDKSIAVGFPMDVLRDLPMHMMQMKDDPLFYHMRPVHETKRTPELTQRISRLAASIPSPTTAPPVGVMRRFTYFKPDTSSPEAVARGAVAARTLTGIVRPPSVHDGWTPHRVMWPPRANDPDLAGELRKRPRLVHQWFLVIDTGVPTMPMAILYTTPPREDFRTCTDTIAAIHSVRQPQCIPVHGSHVTKMEQEHFAFLATLPKDDLNTQQRLRDIAARVAQEERAALRRTRVMSRCRLGDTPMNLMNSTQQERDFDMMIYQARPVLILRQGHVAEDANADVLGVMAIEERWRVEMVCQFLQNVMVHDKDKNVYRILPEEAVVGILIPRVIMFCMVTVPHMDTKRSSRLLITAYRHAFNVANSANAALALCYLRDRQVFVNAVFRRVGATCEVQFRTRVNVAFANNKEELLHTAVVCGSASCSALLYHTERHFCSRCGEIAYCDSICQRADWKRHKQDCARDPDAKWKGTVAPRFRPLKDRFVYSAVQTDIHEDRVTGEHDFENIMQNLGSLGTRRLLYGSSAPLQRETGEAASSPGRSEEKKEVDNKSPVK